MATEKERKKKKEMVVGKLGGTQLRGLFSLQVWPRKAQLRWMRACFKKIRDGKSKKKTKTAQAHHPGIWMGVK